MKMSRRDVVSALFSAVALDAVAAPEGGEGLTFGPFRPFSWDGLRRQAKSLAQLAYRPRVSAFADRLDDLDFDAIGQIRYRPDAALWRGDRRIGAVEFFHLGRYARTPVTIHAVEAGMAREVCYGRNLFNIPAGNPGLRLPDSLGFAGFRVLDPGGAGDWIAYLGAAYFRSAEPFNQYGLSARGLAIDTAVAGPEEFPAFTAFWLERVAEGLVVYALLEGPSVAGAYRITHRRGPTGLVQEIEADLTFRSAVRQLGVAPLTSMYWYASADRPDKADWRPQIHDSDGLSMWTGSGERMFRPLNDPPKVVTHAFADTDPKGFGLMQRDRTFADYQDDGAFYDRRPSAWIEPMEPWGHGSVRLVEIPTDSETNDNIVAFWTPARQIAAGDDLRMRYRLHWSAAEPTPSGVAVVVATRIGRGGRPGLASPPGLRKYVVDFHGGRLSTLDRSSGVTPVVSASVGKPIDAVAYPVVGADRWRLMFDIAAPLGGTVDLRAYLRLGQEALTETWIDAAYG